MKKFKKRLTLKCYNKEYSVTKLSFKVGHHSKRDSQSRFRDCLYKRKLTEFISHSANQTYRIYVWICVGV